MIERYGIGWDGYGSWGVVEDPSGGYVRYNDYKDLKEQLLHIADWLSVVPHETERAAMVYEIRGSVYDEQGQK